MRKRTPVDEMERDALEALHDATRAVGLASSVRPGDGFDDLVLDLSGRTPIRVDVQAASIPSAARVRALVERLPKDAIRVLVADQVPAGVRSLLNEAGVGWLDRRGHIRIVGPGLHVDTDVTPIPRGMPGGVVHEPIAGRSGLASAAALLLRPEEPLGVSEIARVAGLNPSSITRAMTSMVSAHLVERRGRGDYRALVPELFWALADVWPREQVTIHWANPPERDARLDLANDDIAQPGWALAGVRGAVAWGAPIVATADFPLRLYAPDERRVREMKLRNEGGSGDQAVLSADPVGLLTRDRHRIGSLLWPVAHPLFCALDLTVSARDREALEQWTPPEGFTRVW